MIAVGGNSRKAGKTSVICALIRALPDAAWTAIKITPHAHSGSAGGDTARFLAAGARKAMVLSAVPPEWPEGNVIVESGSAENAGLRLLVLDTTTAEFKLSALAMLPRADAFIVTRGEWDGRGRPVFYAPPPSFECADLAAFVRERMEG
ncbi:MAG: hypothetical protein ACM3ZB_10745 [bacterium]